MAGISLCMIVKDEGVNLRRCLKSVLGAVDEIVVVDTGSTDDTPRVAAEYGAKVFSYPWPESFGAARNVSLDLAGGEWILVLDADEELAPGSGETLRRLTAAGDHEGYFVKIVNYLGGDEWAETCPDLVFRLFRNRPEYRFRGAIHEQIAEVIREKRPDAAYGTAEDLVIFHYGYLDRQIAAKDKKNRNLRLIYRELLAHPEDRLLRYHYGVELYRVGEFKAAAEEFRRAAEGLDPRVIYFPKLLRYLVLCYHAAGERQAALEIIRRGIGLFPDYADLYYYAGLILRQEKDYAGAREYFRRALSTPPPPTHYASFDGVRTFRIHYELGEMAEELLDEETALREYLASLRENPSFAPAFLALLRLLDPYRAPEKTRESLAKVCEFSTPQANLWAGRLLCRIGAYRLALKYLEEGAPAPGPPPEIALLKAIALAQNRRFTEAYPILAGFGPGDPLYPQARWNDFFYRWWRKEKGVEAAAKKLFNLPLPVAMKTVTGLLLAVWPGKRRSPGWRLATEEKGFFLEIIARILDLGEKERAIEMLKRLTPETFVELARPAGEIFRRYGDYETAEMCLRCASASAPKAADFFLLGEIKREKGEWPAAVFFYRQAILLAPRERRYRLSLARLYEEIRLAFYREAGRIFPAITEREEHG